MNDLAVVLSEAEALAWLHSRSPHTTTQTELARAWGWNDMRVSRQLMEWEDAGLISREGRKPVTITTPTVNLAVITPVTLPAQRSNNSAPASNNPAARWPSLALTTIGLAIAGVGLTINAWFARSLGATDFAGWLFLAIGLTSDAAALVLPTQAMALWSRRQPIRAVIAWVLWSLTSAFALVASVGFASLNIADTLATRAGRSSPGIELAQRTVDTLAKSREAECVRRGDRCRALEADERQALADLASARRAVASGADPQARAGAELIAWLTFGSVHPGADDLAKFRLALFTLLPQLGGLLLMIAARR